MGKTYQEFLAQYSKSLEFGPKGNIPRHLLPESAHDPMIAQLRQDLFADHRTLVQYKSLNLEEWLLPPKYLGALSQLPTPPLQSAAGRQQLTRNRDEAIRLLWWNFRLEVMQGLAVAGEIRCPILNHAPRLGEKIGFPDPEDANQEVTCKRFIEAKCCGSYTGRFLLTQPDCPFKFAVSHILGELNVEFQFEENS